MDLGNSYNNITFLAWRQMSAVRNPALCNACWERAEHVNATGQTRWEGEEAKNTPCRFIPSEAGAKQSMKYMPINCCQRDALKYHPETVQS